MKISQIIVETSTTAGSVASVAKPMTTQTRENTNVRGLKPVQQVMKGAKKKGPYANSIVEGKVKELTQDLKNLSSYDFEKKYNQTKSEAKAEMKKVNEDDLSEQDLIVIPGQGRLRKTGFVKHDPDRAEHEGQTLKNSLHTIIRVATHLDKELSVRDNFPEWVSEKIGATKSMMVNVMDYLLSAKEMQHDPDAMESAGVIAGGLAYEASSDAGNEMNSMAQGELHNIARNAKQIHNLLKVGKKLDTWEYSYITVANDHLQTVHEVLSTEENPIDEGAKVDRMVKHIEKSEKKLGHSKKEAENIAWATANKRGMLDNKNKKK